MLSFELKPSSSRVSDELEIYCDGDGLASLIAQLQLLGRGRTDHVHLMSASWGGSHLTDGPVSASNTALHHVKIHMVSRAQANRESDG